MNAETESISPTRIKITVTVSKDEKAEARKKAIRKYTAESSLKGYRKGKAPEALVVSAFAAEIAAETIQSAFEKALGAAVKEKSVNIYEQISIGDRMDADGGGTSLSAVFDTVPEFELPQYEGLPVDGGETPVTDEDVGAFLEDLRKYRAKYEDIAPGAPAADGDFLTISYEASMDGAPLADAVPDAGDLAKKDAAWCPAGAEHYRIPGLAKALLGACVGDAKTVAVAFPDDYAKESLRGKTAEYAVAVKSGRHAVLPEIDDDFAKGAKFADLAALKDSVRRRLEIEAAEKDASRRRNQIASALISAASFEVPQAAYERGVQSALDQLIEQALRSGQSREEIGGRREGFLENARRFVLDDMRLAFITGKIADALGITLSDDEYQTAIANYAAANRLAARQMEEFAKRERQTRWLLNQTLRLKVLDALMEKAVKR